MQMSQRQDHEGWNCIAAPLMMTKQSQREIKDVPRHTVDDEESSGQREMENVQRHTVDVPGQRDMKVVDCHTVDDDEVPGHCEMNAVKRRTVDDDDEVPGQRLSIAAPLMMTKFRPTRNESRPWPKSHCTSRTGKTCKYAQR